MAKEPKKPISISMAELKKLPRNEQRRYLDLGYVEGVEPPAVQAEVELAKAEAAKPKA
jgi:hypothetical protein